MEVRAKHTGDQVHYRLVFPQSCGNSFFYSPVEEHGDKLSNETRNNSISPSVYLLLDSCRMDVHSAPIADS